MRIIGIDPGYAITGFGIIEYTGNHFKLINSGAIETKAGVPFPNRLQKIYDDMMTLIDEYKPDAISIEELFFNTNTTTAIGVAQGRGAVLIAASKTNTPIYEYTPLQIKQALTGNGRAEKKQIQYMVKSILGLKEVPKPDDAADAVAVAITHLQTNSNLTDNRI